MRILKATEEQRLRQVASSVHERFFVELWYELTHPHSLDSYRARCLNTRTQLMELVHELRIRRANDLELARLFQEALEFLDEDGVICEHYPINQALCQALLKEQAEQFATQPWTNPGPGSKEKKPAERDRLLDKLLVQVEDFSHELAGGYLDHLCTAIPKAIEAGDRDLIVKLTGALVSDLVHAGWTLSGLHSWYHKFLGSGSRPFAEDLSFMLRELRRPAQAYLIVLHIVGSSKIVDVKHYRGFDITKAAPTVQATILSPQQRQFLKESPSWTFAAGEVSAQDPTSATIKARSIIEQVLDLVRFDYERSALRIDAQGLAERKDDGKVFLAKTHQVPPNPSLRPDFDNLKRLTEELDRLLAHDDVEAETKEQLRAALRQYRVGKDSEGDKDKFLSWWLGLEALARSGAGGIGETVVQNTSRALLHGYLPRLLIDLLQTLKYRRIPWNPDLAKRSGAESLATLTCAGLFELLSSPTERATLFTLIGSDSLVAWRVTRLCEMLQRPAQALERHRQHLEWQLQRLYRIRCCIVHGSAVRFPLELFAANLEFYLKQLIGFVLDTFSRYPHVRSLEQLYRRSTLNWERRIKVLMPPSAKGAAVPQDLVMADIFSDVVTKEAHRLF